MITSIKVWPATGGGAEYRLEHGEEHRHHQHAEQRAYHKRAPHYAEGEREHYHIGNENRDGVGHMKPEKPYRNHVNNLAHARHAADNHLFRRRGDESVEAEGIHCDAENNKQVVFGVEPQFRTYDIHQR